MTKSATEADEQVVANKPLPVFAVIEAGANPDRWKDRWERIGKGRHCMLLRTRATGPEAKQDSVDLAESGLLLFETYDDAGEAAVRSMQLERSRTPRR